jgi:RHS repeat-associated protein
MGVLVFPTGEAAKELKQKGQSVEPKNRPRCKFKRCHRLFNFDDYISYDPRYQYFAKNIFFCERFLLTLRMTDYSQAKATLFSRVCPARISAMIDEKRAKWKQTLLMLARFQENPLSDGKRTDYFYDYHNRLVQTVAYPRTDDSQTNGLKALATTRTYLDNLLFSTEDPYGRMTYYAYRDTDKALVRIVQGTVPSYGTDPQDPFSNFTDILDVTRDSSPNANHLLTEYVYDATGQVTQITDPRGIVNKTEYNSRGQVTQRIVDFGNGKINATTQTDYSLDGEVTEVRTPRYVEDNDTHCREQWTYSRRGLELTHTVAAGDTGANGTEATEAWEYNNFDGSLKKHWDFNQYPQYPNGTFWETTWSTCCAGRVISQIDPLTATQTFQYDNSGNVTVKEMMQSSTTYRQTTSRFDGRNRPVAQTVWLDIQSSVDPQSPPIAGLDAGYPTSQGLTTQWYYNENLADDSTVVVQLLNVSGTTTLNLQKFLDRLNNDYGTNAFFNSNCKGSAVVTVNPMNEISVVIRDGAGRTVASGMLDSSGNLLSCRTIKNDDTVPLGSDDFVETSQIVRSFIDQNSVGSDVIETAKTRADGAGRTIESEDTLQKVTAYKYDANRNLVSVRDPNGVGWNAGTSTTDYSGYDNLNRLTVRCDTYNDKTKTYYDINNNVVKTVDAKNYSTEDHYSLFKYDARDRKYEADDRLDSPGVTTWKFDPNGNLLELCDADNQAADKPTAWTYNERNQKVTEEYPDHSGTLGQGTYDKRLFAYDPIGRLQKTTQQDGSTITLNYDHADRMTQRDYRTTDGGNIVDSDTFTFDDAGRMLTAVSGRYNNTVTMAYELEYGAGQVTTETFTMDSNTWTTYSQYDATGRRTKIWYPDNANRQNLPTVWRSYDERDQLDKLWYRPTNVQNGLPTDTPAADYAYDDAGRRTTRTLGDTPGTVTTWSYRSSGGLVDNLISGITDNRNPHVIDFTYEYDADKNKTKETLGAPMADYGFGTRRTTAYDNEDRLTQWGTDKSSGYVNQDWTLTKAGDWSVFTQNGTQQNRTHDNVHQLTQVGATTKSYDAKGNLLTSSLASSGNYVWDFDNRLITIPGIGGYYAGNKSFAYDALGRRVRKLRNYFPIVGMSWFNYIYFISDGQQEIMEYERQVYEEQTAPPGGGGPQGAGAMGGGGGTSQNLPSGQNIALHPLRKFIYAVYIDEPVLMVNSGANPPETETKFYYHQNNLYSTGALTAQDGSVAERTSYTAYGKVTFHNVSTGVPLATQPRGSSLGNPFLFTGRRLEPDDRFGLQVPNPTNDFYYYRARYYDAVMGRFIGRDPIGYNAHCVNLYELVYDNPINFKDPSGKQYIHMCDPTMWSGAHEGPINEPTAPPEDKCKGKWIDIPIRLGCADGMWYLRWGRMKSDLEDANEVWAQCCIRFKLINSDEPIIIDKSIGPNGDLMIDPNVGAINEDPFPVHNPTCVNVFVIDYRAGNCSW